jgi:poly(3-hydroxybutyrate) depolymerase
MHGEIATTGKRVLNYSAYETIRKATRPLAWLLEGTKDIARHELNPMRNSLPNRIVATLCEVPFLALKDYPKPAFNVERHGDDENTYLREHRVQRLPFADLIGFEVENAAEKPKVLIAAALSGHHATLLRDTVKGFARDFAPFITDWRDARQVPLSEGDFGLDDFVEYLIQFMRTLGPGTHMVATCQAAPAALMAAAVLAETEPQLVPASLTLMAGPMDVRVNPGLINKMTDYLPLKLFRASNIKKVPGGFPGAGRRIYPGYYQLSGFMLLNPKSHIQKTTGFVKDGVRGNHDANEVFRNFYDEYFAVLDMTESFYLESLERIFFEHHLPRGLATFRGKPIDFGLLNSMPLLTVEGGNDNMCTRGQTEAAHDICPNIPKAKRKHHVQEGVGHYGVFSGSRFQSDIYPVARDFIRKHQLSAGA